LKIIKNPVFRLRPRQFDNENKIGSNSRIDPNQEEEMCHDSVKVHLNGGSGWYRKKRKQPMK
jgi:hypothetical protein